MKEQKVTDWKELRTGMIYKYVGESKPYRYETEWKETTAWEYEELINRLIDVDLTK